MYKNFEPTIQFVEIEEDGFRLGVKCRLIGKTILQRKFKKYYWNNIREINGWNDDIITGLEFVDCDGKHTIVNDYLDNWDQFVNELPGLFTGFNTHNYISACLLAWGTLPCWKSDQAIGNLIVKDDVIVWEKDGSVFCKFKE